MPSRASIFLRSHAAAAIWITMAALLLLGSILGGLGTRTRAEEEARQAVKSGQRAIIDAQHGTVALENPLAVPRNAFDVAEPPPPSPPNEPAAAAKPTPPAEAEATPPAEAKNTEPPHAESPAADHDDADAPRLRTAPITPTPPPATGETLALVPAPAPEITENIGGVVLPKIGEKNTAARQMYARNFQRSAGVKPLSILITDAGMNAQSVGMLLTLPPQISVAISPYAHNAAAIIKRLRSRGIEVWTYLPVAGEGYPADDPGPLGLVVSLPEDEIVRRTRTAIAETIGSVGVVFPADEQLSRRLSAVRSALKEALSRGLYVLAARPTQTLESWSKSEDELALLRRADVTLDPLENEALITSKLAGILPLLQEKGHLIVTASARPQTLQLLGAWLRAHPPQTPTALAPLSAQWLPKQADAPASEGSEEKKEGHEAKPAAEEKAAKPAGH